MLEEANLAYRNKGNLDFDDVSQAWGLDQVGVSFGAAMGDLDGDGDLDIVFGNYEKSVTVMRNDSATGHRMMVALRGTQSNKFGYGAKLTAHTVAGVQVRQVVPARGYLSSSDPVVHFGLGEMGRIERLEIEWPSGVKQVLTDLETDRRYVITEPSEGPVTRRAPGEATAAAGEFVEVSESLRLNVEVPEGAWTEDNRQPLLTTRFDRRGPALAVADLNGDGQNEVVVGGSSRTPITALVRSTSGRYESNGALGDVAQTATGPMLLIEVNGDSRPDVLLTQAGTEFNAGAEAYQPKLLLNDGRGGWTLAGADVLPSFPVSVGALAAADFNRDGRLDVFVGGRVEPGKYPTSPRSGLWLNRGGRFEDVTATVAAELAVVGMVTSAVWSDVDQDGWIDLVVTTEWGGVSAWRNESGRTLHNASEEWGFTSAGTGWWTSVASADFNQDGRPDFALGNVGLNTPYRASPEHPALLFRGNFVGRGRSAPKLIEAYYQGDRLYPRQTLKALAGEIRTLTRTFRRNDDYAAATLEEVFTPEILAAADRYAATELRSGVLLSDASGRYRFQPLLRETQIAPMQGLVAGDVDGDGHADIYAVQNSFAPASVVGRFTGGLSQLLRGDGRGGFAAVDPAQSGLVVTGDAKALVCTDLNADGWPDFVTTRNNSSTKAFQNQPIAGRRMFNVRLRGPVGNPSGVGARVALEVPGTPLQAAEVGAGGGYWSQSDGSVFFGLAASTTGAEIKVRWPDGSVSAHSVRADQKTVELVAPTR